MTTNMPLRLAEILFEELDALRSGESDPTRAKAVALLASVAIKCQEVAIEMNKPIDVESLPLVNPPKLPPPGSPRMIKGHAMSGGK